MFAARLFYFHYTLFLFPLYLFGAGNAAAKSGFSRALLLMRRRVPRAQATEARSDRGVRSRSDCFNPASYLWPMPLTDYQDALELTLKQRFDWGEETVPLADAGGRILAQPLLTDRPQPPFDRVTMDGIAINHAPYAEGRRLFPVAGVVPAGAEPLPLTDPTTCLEVMTGAVLPAGTTTIIRYEDLERVGEAFRLPEGVVDAKNIHRTGSDAAAGATLLQPGAEINGAAINLLASCGYAMVTVKRLPRLTVIATGDELVAVAQDPLPHQIRMSNVYHLRHQLRKFGIEARIRHLADDVAELRESIADLLEKNDVLVFSGGVSKGKYDFLPEVLAGLGVNQLFHRVAQRPGKPLWVGRTQQTMVFGLPGNPVSGLVGMTAYVAPFLRKNLGITYDQVWHELYGELHFDKDLTLFQIAYVQPGTQLAVPLTNEGSGDATSMLRGEGFLVFPKERSTFGVGEWLEFLRY